MGIIVRGRAYHYDFIVDGQRHTGKVPIEGNAITHETTAVQMEALRKAAEKWMEDRKAELYDQTKALTQVAEDVRRNKTVRALVENYRFELTGGHPVELDEAPALARKKPWARMAIEKVWAQRISHWNDFALFLKESYRGGVRYLSDIRRAHAEAYIAHLAEHGRYSGLIHQKGRASYSTAGRISPSTIRKIYMDLKAIIGKLKEDAGIVDNPFEGVVIPKGDATERQIFTRDELRLIGIGIGEDREKAGELYKGRLPDSWEAFAIFCRPLFLIASATGLTEGDICMLRWDEVDWSCSVIRHRRRKTSTPMVIPILPVLADFLRGLPRSGEYVLPEHAKMYTEQRPGVPYRVKFFLNGMGIKTTEKGAAREVSVKDLHSMRHVFCYYAIRAGIPAATVAKIVGHRTVSMTEHYADHATAADLCAAVSGLPQVLTANADIEGDELRERLVCYARTLPIERVRALLASLDSACGPERIAQ